MAAECVNRPGPRYNSALCGTRFGMKHSSFYWDSVYVDDQLIPMLANNYVFVVIVGMRGGSHRLTIVPKRHPDPVLAIEKVALESRSRLVGFVNPICRMLHEFWKNCPRRTSRLIIPAGAPFARITQLGASTAGKIIGRPSERGQVREGYTVCIFLQSPGLYPREIYRESRPE